jgi:hypothetical protein
LRDGLLVAAGVILLLPTIQALPRRAALVDRSDDRAATAWTADVLRAVEANAVIVSWWSYSTPLWYAQVVDDRRPDVCVIDDRNRLDYDLGELSQVIDRYIATRPVYLIRNGDSELPALVGRYTVTRVPLPAAGNLLRVTPVASGGTNPTRLASVRTAGTGAADSGRRGTNTPALRADCP